MGRERMAREREVRGILNFHCTYQIILRTVEYSPLYLVVVNKILLIPFAAMFILIVTGCLFIFASKLPLVCKEWPWLPSSSSAGFERRSARLLDENTAYGSGKHGQLFSLGKAWAIFHEITQATLGLIARSFHFSYPQVTLSRHRFPPFHCWHVRHFI